MLNYDADNDDDGNIHHFVSDGGRAKEKTSVGLNQQVAIFKIQYNTQFHVRIQFEFFCSVPPNLILFCDIF